MSNDSNMPQIRLRTRAPDPANLAADSAPQEYAVGYGRPPQSGQFRPGQSGNPKGRPKGSRNLASIIREVTEQKVTLRTPRGVRKIPAIEAVLRRLVEQALKGDGRAITQLLAIRRATLPDGNPDENAAERVHPLSQTDEAILQEFAASILAGSNGEGGGDA